jgi:hypothetical protein
MSYPQKVPGPGHAVGKPNPADGGVDSIRVLDSREGMRWTTDRGSDRAAKRTVLDSLNQFGCETADMSEAEAARGVPLPCWSKIVREVPLP